MRLFQYRSRSEAAQWLTECGLRCSARTLAKYASIGGGPSYRRFGNRVVYSEADLNSWIESKLSEPKGLTAEAA